MAVIFMLVRFMFVFVMLMLVVVFVPLGGLRLGMFVFVAIVLVGKGDCCCEGKCQRCDCSCHLHIPFEWSKCAFQFVNGGGELHVELDFRKLRVKGILNVGEERLPVDFACLVQFHASLFVYGLRRVMTE